MVLRVATPCLQWSQPGVPHQHQTLASALTSPLALRRTGNEGSALVYLYPRPSLPSRLYRARSFELPKPRFPSLRRSCSAGCFDSSFSDEDFSRKIQELSLRFQSPDADSIHSAAAGFLIGSSEEDNGEKQPPDNDWVAGGGEIVIGGIGSNLETSPLTMTMTMTRTMKNQWQEEFREAGESAYCSMKKAFSSMVFIIRELHGFMLQMRELLYYEDLREIWFRVQKEMHVSFVWLFQQVFSHTPTLMVYVMILLANFTVHSMSTNTALAGATASTHSVVSIQNKDDKDDDRTQKFDSFSAIKSFTVTSSSGGKTATVGGIYGGGGKVRPPIASGTEGDGWLENSVNLHRAMVPDGAGVSQLSSPFREEAVTGEDETAAEKEVRLWESVVEEAARMQMELRDEALDAETVSQFVSPVTAAVEEEGDDYEEYTRTEIMYQMGLAQEPNNSLLLANYAQFLCVVLRDYVRAEDYFKRAVAMEPKDAEACNKYANFLWQVKKDLWAAEETYLEAISAEPENSFYAANYAHFLWNTGGEDTCFPLDSEGGPSEC